MNNNVIFEVFILIKIAIVGTTAQSIFGFRLDLIKMLISKNYKVYAFATDYTEDNKEKLDEMGVVPVDYTLSRSGLNPLNDLICVIKLILYIKKINPDVVFSYFSKPSIYGTLAAHFCGVKKIYAMLEGLGYLFTEQPNGQKLKDKILKLIQINLYKFSFKKLDGLILLNNDDKKDLIEKYNIKVKNVLVLGGIGLDLEHYYKSTPPLSPVSFIFVGRLLVEKGVYEFLAAARIIKDKYPCVQFNIIGDIDEGNPGSLTKKELNILLKDNIINYHGYVNNVAEWIAKSSVFVLPSYREGFPRSTQEAMAIGRAVITTDVPGCRDTVQRGVNGFIVERWSSHALAESIEKIIKNPFLIEKMGESSYLIAKDKYDAHRVNIRLLRFIGL